MARARGHRRRGGRKAEDIVLSYARARRWKIQRNNVVLEGTSDASLFSLARDREKAKTGVDVFGDGLAFFAAGFGDQGGTAGVLRELTTLRSLSDCVLDQSGRQRYRFVGLVDNDSAGRRSLKLGRSLNPQALEFRDLVRLRPVMPKSGNLDVQTLQRCCERLNLDFRGQDWELEDLIGENLVRRFLESHASALLRRHEVGGKVHWEFALGEKPRLHRFVERFARAEDLVGVLDAIRAIRFLLRLPMR